MSEFTAYRDVSVMDGRDCLSSFEVRYTFTITAGRAARTWTTASDGNFYPAEAPSIDLTGVATRWHKSQPWREVDGQAFDMLCADVPDQWFIDQAMEAAE